MVKWIRKTWRRIRLGLARWRAVPGRNPGYWPVKAIQPWHDGEGKALDPATGRWVSSSVPYGSIQCPICGMVIPVCRPSSTLAGVVAVAMGIVWCENCRVDLW